MIDPLQTRERINAGATRAVEYGRSPKKAFVGTEAYADLMRYLVFNQYGRVDAGGIILDTPGGEVTVTHRTTLHEAVIVEDERGDPWIVD